MADGKHRLTAVDKIAGKGDEAFITTQLVGRVAPGSNKASNSPGVTSSMALSMATSAFLLTLHRFASLLFDRDDLMPGELKGFGGRGKFRIFKVVGNEDGYLLLMLPPLSGWSMR